MELFGELFLTASLALFLSFLVAKLVAVAMAAGESDSKSTSRVSDMDFVEALRLQSSGTERRVEFVDVATEKVDHLREEVVVEEISEERSEIVGLSRATASEDVRADDCYEESSRKTEVFGEIAAEPGARDVISAEPEEARVPGGESGGEEEASEVEWRRSDCDDDDWEGIERDELESDFAAAAKFVEARDGLSDPLANVLGNDVQMELYGLRKVATEGTCHEPLSPALDPSARAKCDGGQWFRCARNAWQRLGSMTRDMAMEEYIRVLSEKVPGWMEDHLLGGIEQECSEKAHHTVAVALSTNERKPEIKSCVDRVGLTETSNLNNKAT